MLHSADGLVAFQRDPCVPGERECSNLDKFPGVGQFSISPVVRRRNTAAGQAPEKDAKDLPALLDAAAALLAQGKADYVRGSPFVLDESDYVKPALLDVLDEVSADWMKGAAQPWAYCRRVVNCSQLASPPAGLTHARHCDRHPDAAVRHRIDLVCHSQV